MRRYILSAGEASALLARQSTWNAVIAVRLRHVIKLFHQSTPGHGDDGWSQCTHEECRCVAELLNTDLPPGDQSR